MQLPSCQYHKDELEGNSLMGSQLDKSLTFLQQKFHPSKLKSQKLLLQELT